MAVESDSSNPDKWGEIDKMLNMTAERLRELGASVELADVGTQQVTK